MKGSNNLRTHKTSKNRRAYGVRYFKIFGFANVLAVWSTQPSSGSI